MRWTVGRKLVLSFFLIAILMVAIGAFSVYNLNRLNASTEAILRENQPVLTDMAAIESGTLFHSLKVDQYVTTGNKAHLRAVEELRKDVETHLADLEDRAHGTEDQQIVQEIREAYDTYVSLSDGLQAFYQSNPDDMLSIEGRQMRIAALLENALLAKADTLYEAKQSKTQELVQANHQLYLAYVRTTAVSGLALTLLAIALGILISRSIIVPIGQLVEATKRIADGDLTTKAQVRTGDEIGLLANAFNSMAAQLRELIENLERRVAERTHEYEEAVVRTQQAYAQLYEAHQKLGVTTYQAQRRAIQLETAAEVSRAATSVLDPDELVRQAVNLIRDRFDLYYAGLFLLDESGRWAVLRAGTGEAGRQMLKAGHKLEVASQSMVGWCTANAQARIALDVGEEAVRFDNPLLPETRSEIALPLISRGQVIGALDVQSVEAGAFPDEDIAVLQTMADQIAVAIDNAHLLTEAQARLEEVQAVHRSYLKASWDAFLPTKEIIDYEYLQPGVTLFSDAVLPEVEQAIAQQHTVVLSKSDDGKEEPALAQSAMVTPITLRGQVIGALGLHEGEGTRQWTADDIALVEAVADQMALAIENARLFEEARIRAEELAVLNELGQALTARLSVEEVLEEAYQQASRLVDTTNFYIGLYDPESDEINFAFDISESVQDQELTVISADQGLAGYIIRNRTSVLFKENVRERQEALGIEMVGEEPLSWLGVPLIVGDRVLGVMAVQNFTTPHAYDEHARDLLTAIASPTAIALQNAYLFEQTQAALAQTEALYKGSEQVIRATTIDDVLQALIHSTALQRLDRVSIAFFNRPWEDEIPEEATTAATWERSGQESQAPVGTRYSLAQFFVIEMVTRSEPAIFRDIATDENVNENLRVLLLDRLGMRSLILWPLVVGEQWIGILTGQAGTALEIDEDEIRQITSLTNQAATVIQNRRLFEEAQARARRERLIREISGKVQRSVDLDSILQTTVQELGKALGASRAVIRLGTEAESATPTVKGQADSAANQYPAGGNFSQLDDKTGGENAEKSLSTEAELATPPAD